MITYRFGPYEFRIGVRRLSKHGIRLRLQSKPAGLLQALLETPGELVTRDALRERVWLECTPVDFEGGLNTAIHKLRAALHDDTESPRFLETLPRLGYRFIHPVVREGNQPVSHDLQTAAVLTSATALPHHIPAIDGDRLTGDVAGC